MDIPLTTNFTPNASCLQNNQQQATNIDKVKKNSKRQSKKYPCTVKGCDQILASKQTLSDHLLVHKNEKTYLCDKCDNSFNTIKALRYHKKNHEDRKFICYPCDRSFICIQHLNRHNKASSHIRKINNILEDNYSTPSTSSIQSKKYPCTVKGCDQILSSKHTLSNHLIAHKNEKKYLCDDYKKGFNTEKTLKQHKKTHEDKQFTCSTCDLSFVRKKYLKQHNESASHISKENNTETASKLSRERAAKLAGFIKYSQQHTAKSNNSNTSSIQPKNYPCPFESCTLILSKKYTLIDHILIHQDEKTYHCDSCKTRVNTAKELRRHKKKHGNNKLICYTCNKTFFRKDLLDRHNKTALHARKIKNILADYSPYKPDPCITDDKSYSIGIVTELHSRLNPENQDVYQDNNNPDSLKLPDNTMIYAESAIQEEDYLSDIEKDFNENNLLDIEISSDEDNKYLQQLLHS